VWAEAWYTEKIMFEPTRTNQWKFFLHAHTAWESMLEDCRNARVSIDMEQYIFVPDTIGKQFIAILEQKVREGVRVRLLCDAAGSYTLYKSAYAKQLIVQGAEILFFNPISPWRINNYTSWFFRDHRKVLVVDSHIGHIGGVGVYQQMHDWRDTNVRIEGSIVHELSAVFDQMWNRTKEGKFFRFSAPFFNAELRNSKPQGLTKYFYFLTNSPRFHQRFIYHSLIDAIRSARRHIYLTTPYFVPDLRLLRVLRLAVRRGVDVRLVVPKTSNHAIVDFAARSYFGIILRAGVRIFLYHDRMMHAKTVVIDDDWASVGSANLDSLSLLLNYEANLVCTNRSFVNELKGHCTSDMESCREIVLSQWKQRSRLQKVFEMLTWPLHKFL